MKTTEIAEMSGRAVAKIMRMSKADAPEEWTEMKVDAIELEASHGSQLVFLKARDFGF